MNHERVSDHGLDVAQVLHSFVQDEALPGSGISGSTFWNGVRAILTEFGPRNRLLLARRDELQRAIDNWHRLNPGPIDDQRAYIQMLRDSGYLLDEPVDFIVETADVDDEVALIAGPQLVVPMLNARFAANATNARWGSLYDAFYGTNVIPETHGRERRASYNPCRGAEVIARGRQFLDDFFPLSRGSHAEATGYSVSNGALAVQIPDGFAELVNFDQFVGYRGHACSPTGVLLVHHGLHIEIEIDSDHGIGRTDKAGVKDIIVESAISTIMDLEDSVVAVDAHDKVLGYRTWLQLNQGTLSAAFEKDGRTYIRTLAADRIYTSPNGQEGGVVRHGRSLLFVRQVGLLMTTDAVLLDGEEVPEGILDAIITTLCSLVDIQGRGALTNSRKRSMYAVKPKLHGADEVQFTSDLFAAVEALFSLRRGTIKLGLMDEERRTSTNLKGCIYAARDRIAFINTGFLDRTGDELHTAMLAGPMLRKGEMKATDWIAAYEALNVEVGLSAGLQGRAQIGKGMWAMPNEMARMVKEKVDHPQAGASCAWVPSPTAATLHALHYHQVDVRSRQTELREAGKSRYSIEHLLSVPVADRVDWSDKERIEELESNLQSILGYVKRWVDNGVGCSKVPDLHGTALMEDRATCRISAQHVANWLYHGIVDAHQVESALRRMADMVDLQNIAAEYRPMGPSYNDHAFNAAHDLVFEGIHQPSGYTEPILHRHRSARMREGLPS